MNCSICKWYNETTDYCFAIYCNAEDICPQKQYEKGRADGIYELEKALHNKFNLYDLKGTYKHRNDDIRNIIRVIAEQLKEQK